MCVVVVLWQLQSLNLFSALAGRRGALYHRATPRRHLSSGVLSEHAYLFSDNSLFSLNRTKKIVSIFFFLSIKTDELKVKKKKTKRTAASHECNRRACSHTVQTSAVLFLPSHSSHFCTEENESREERKLVLSGGGPQKKKIIIKKNVMMKNPRTTGETDSTARHAESAHRCQPTMPSNYVIRPSRW